MKIAKCLSDVHVHALTVHKHTHARAHTHTIIITTGTCIKFDHTTDVTQFNVHEYYEKL